VTRGKFDALVVHGHTPAAVLIAAAAARKAGVPVFCRAETHLGLSRPALKRLVRKPLMGAFYRFVNGVLAIGSANATFYRAMGVPKDRIFFMPYTIDNARFVEGARISQERRTEVRAALGVSDDAPILLYAAKLQVRKHPDDLIRAALRLREWGARFHVVVVGSGEMAEELTGLVARYKLENVHFRGFVNQKILPQVYAAADVFVLPSEDESWGLTVNEAMCAGLPVVVSKGVGCVADLVRNNVNGRIFVPRDIEGLAMALHSILLDAEARRRMGAASRDIISRWSYAESAAGLQRALNSIGIGQSPRLRPAHS
jgi:glycosyltransferase involved in cell wall biosynthesis